jgi:hypothetical protein
MIQRLLALALCGVLLCACGPRTVTVIVVTATPEPVPTITPTVNTAYVEAGTIAQADVGTGECTLSAQRVNVIERWEKYVRVHDGQCDGWVEAALLSPKPQ